MRRNFKKYSVRRSIREEWKKRIDIARKNEDRLEYAHAIHEYWIITKKIRRYYDWLEYFTGRKC